MQTFLPYAMFYASAACLDRARLGKQRVEAWQVVRAIRGETRGWVSHPAAKMWRGHEHALAHYGLAMCREWTARGYADSLAPRFADIVRGEPLREHHIPPWLGDAALHASHRSNLLRKLPAHYGALGWSEPNDLPYVWPVP